MLANSYHKADGKILKQVKLAKAEFSKAYISIQPKGNGMDTEYLSCSAYKDGNIWNMELIPKPNMDNTPRLQAYYHKTANAKTNTGCFATIEDQLKQQFLRK